MSSFSAIILGYYIKVKSVLVSFTAIFEKCLLHNICSLYPTIRGGHYYDFFHLKHSFNVNNCAKEFEKMN